MFFGSYRLALLSGLVATMVATDSYAVIVAGANGVGSQNTTNTQLESTLGSAFPYFENVVRVGSGSGTYLGVSESSGWIVTAKHVVAPSSISISGASYAVDTTFDVSGADVRLVKLDLGPVAPALPSVPVGGGASIGSQVVMLGYGRPRIEPAATSNNKPDSTSVGGSLEGYHWDSGRALRWGLNDIEASPGIYYGIEGGQNVTAVPGLGNGFFTTFDEPSRNYLGSNEAQGSGGDSGGAVFGQDENGDWFLTGVMSQIFTTPGQSSSTAGFGNQTVSVYLPDYESELASLGAFGTQIPEPSVTLLVVFGMVLVISRRVRS